MSDTKALEGFTKKWMWLETVHGAWIYQGVPPMEQAAAELAQLKKRLEIACHVKAKDKVGFDWEVLDTIAQLRAENAEMRERLKHIAGRADHQIPAYAYGDNEAGCEMAMRLNHIFDDARAVLAKYPEVKK